MFGQKDLFSLTPYAEDPFEGTLYSYDAQQRPASGRWRAANLGTAIPVWHFKWHSGVLRKCALLSSFLCCSRVDSVCKK